MDLRQPPQKKIVPKPKKKRHLVRNTLVILFTVILTTLAVNATDNISNLSNSIVGSVISGVVPTQSPCEKGMSLVSSPSGDFCIDTYEVSAGDGCTYKDPQTINQSHENSMNNLCVPVSKEGALPWTNVSQNQAAELCAKDGKRLPSNEEWYLASLGTPDKPEGWTSRDCNVADNWGGGVGATGSGKGCQSGSGVYDMIGNVWEWTYETVNKGNFKDYTLPDAGYVAGVNNEGVPSETTENPNSVYFYDRFWLDKSIVAGMFRGGYWGSLADAGRFTLHAEIPPSFAGAAVGFRCVK